MGQGIFGTDINCQQKLKVGWIKTTDSVTMDIPAGIDSEDFRPSDAKRVSLVNSSAYRHHANSETEGARSKCLVVRIPKTTLPG